MPRNDLVNAFFRGDQLTGKMGEAVRAYIEELEESHRYVGLLNRSRDLTGDDLEFINYYVNKRIKTT